MLDKLILLRQSDFGSEGCSRMVVGGGFLAARETSGAIPT